MHRDPELALLKTRLDAVEAASASQQATAAALAELRASLKSVEDKITLSDRFVKIEEEHESWKTLAKYIAITVSVLGLCGAILGGILTYFGYTSLDKYLEAQVDKRFAYSEDLGYGLALTAKQPSFAIPHLLRCFNEKPSDEPLLIALLNATDNADDWDTQRTIVEELRRHPTKLDSFSDPLTYNNIGIAELNLGFEDASHFARAREAFERGIKIAASNRQETLWYLHTNLWRYYLAANDLSRAKQEVEIAKKLDLPPDVENWAKASHWGWFKAFFARDSKIDKQQVEQMYKEFSKTQD
jgi:hypothetical protein